MKNHIAIASEELFQVSLVGYLILLLTDTVIEDFVSYFFNLNILLGIVLISGMATSLLGSGQPRFEPASTNNSRKKNWLYMSGMSAMSGGLVYIKTSELGNISWLVTALAAGIVFLLSYLIFEEEKNSIVGPFTRLPEYLLKSI